MITFLRGQLAESFPNRAVVDVHGVGYQVHIPVSTYDQLPPPGQNVKILTHFQVREDEQSLYGFASEEERDLFRLLINQVSGIGPKLALAVLSGMTVQRFKACVVNNDVTSLSKLKGLGKKTAERIVLELKDKVGVAAAWQAASASTQEPGQQQAMDAILALITLGYKQVDAQKAVKDALTASPKATADELLRNALRVLNS